MSAIFGATERFRRTIAMERERLEDLVAEGRARYETKRDRKSADSGRGDQAGDQASDQAGDHDASDARGPRAVRRGPRAA